MVTFLGVKTKDNWTHFAWVFNINGVEFNYSTGLGHSKHQETVKNGMIDQYSYSTKKKTPVGYIKQNYKSLDNNIRNDLLRAFNLKLVMWNDERLNDIYIKKPKLKDLLYSIAQDASLASGSFEDFCFNLGYDTDSRKALETYLVCQENASKLKKVLKSKNAIDRVLAWEL